MQTQQIKLYINFLAKRNKENWEACTIFRNFYNKICRKAKILKFRNDIKEAWENSKHLWDILKDYWSKHGSNQNSFALLKTL